MNSVFRFNLNSKNNVLKLEEVLKVQIPIDYYAFLEQINFEDPFELYDDFFEAIKINNEYYSQKYYPQGHLLTFQGFMDIDEIINVNRDNQLLESLGESIGKNKIAFLKEGSVLFLMKTDFSSVEYGSIYAIDFDFVGDFSSNISNPFYYKIASSFTEFIGKFELCPI